jgi:sigma-54 dependent transcriptional regulator, acetoin dehydrogenase operon transcriptional activator AcoR
MRDPTSIRESEGAHAPDGLMASAHIRLAVTELDRLYERICGKGCVLLLADASGTVLYEKADPELRGAFDLKRIRLIEPGRTAGEPLPPELTVSAGPAAAHPPATGMPLLTLDNLAGSDPQMARNVASARRIADSGVSVLIQGPTGSGKEAFAHAMHLASRRARAPFVAVNCAAIPETLIESELMGYKAGAFTGARREGMRGKILQSSGGTLFLDEIGDMPLLLQTRLLRVLESQEIVPLGSEAAIKVSLHVIAASHRNLREMITRGQFRDDLYYRLNGITLELPALRERADRDWVIHQALLCESTGRPAAIEPEALAQLLCYSWPGNVRELRNIVRTALAISDGGVIRRADLPREVREAQGSPARTGTPEAPGPSPNPLQVAERAALLAVIEQQRGNMTRVAAQLGMSRNTLYRRLKRHGIPPAHRH